MLLITAISSLLTLLPSTVHSRPEWIDLFDQVTDNIAPIEYIPFYKRQEEDGIIVETEEVVSYGTVYATCPDLEYITGPMYESDVDRNGFLNQEEYVQFTNEISGGYLSDMGWDDSFTDMPLSLQETYLVLSCLCELYEDQPWGGKGCCTSSAESESDNIGIRTDGTAPGETPDETQLQYLTYVCGTMSESLENVGGEIVSPSTGMPTARPTARPTGRPSSRPTSKVR